MPSGYSFFGFGDISRRCNTVALFTQNFRQDVAYAEFVVDDEDICHFSDARCCSS